MNRQTENMWQLTPTIPAGGEVLYSLMKTIFPPLLTTYVWLTVVLPGGSILGFPLKLPLYVLLLPAAVICFSLHKPNLLLRLSLLLTIPTLFLPWVLLSQCYLFDMTGALRQYADILLTLFTSWLVVVFVEDSESALRSFLRIVVSAEVFVSVMKAGLLSYALWRGIRVTEIVATLDRIFGVDLMTMDLGAIFGRIQFVSDGLIPLCAFAIFRFRRWMGFGAIASTLSVALLLVSVALSFSRYFWVFTLLGILMGLVLGKKDRFFVGIISLFGVLLLLALPLLASLYEARFSADVADSSDDIRLEQIASLDEFFLDAPIFGHGLGSYTSVLLRSDASAKYGYEVQLLALSGQVGIVGMTTFSLLGAYYFRRLWWHPRSRLSDRLACFGLLAVWIAAGLFNPLLLNPVGALSYAMIMCFTMIPTRVSGI